MTNNMTILTEASEKGNKINDLVSDKQTIVVAPSSITQQAGHTFTKQASYAQIENLNSSLTRSNHQYGRPECSIQFKTQTPRCQ